MTMKPHTSPKQAMLMAVIAIAAIIASPAQAMLDPSGVYCESLGYKFVVEKTDAGYIGYCQITPSQKVDSWKFIKGDVAKDKAACAQKGYGLKIIKDEARCWYSDDGECASCVTADGSEVEVTKLLGLSFLESTCGDGTCGMPETYRTCPVDCPSGGADNICDGVKDGRCDPDCQIQNITSQDKDCVAETTIKVVTTTIAASNAQKPTTTTARQAPTTTLAATKPLEGPKDKGCIPFLLAPIALLASVAARSIKVF
jgi:putative hemolysin